MWRATRITADAADKMQANAGILLNEFDVNNPVEPPDSAIICETTGDFSITCTPTTEDFFADVNNAMTNTKEGKRITGWQCGLTVTSISITQEALQVALGASDVSDDGGINPRVQYKMDDFKSFYWLGDMFDENKLFVVVMDDTVSTGGVSFTSTNNGKGGLALTLTPHASTQKRDKVPMAFYILEKIPTEPDDVTTGEDDENVDGQDEQGQEGQSQDEQGQDEVVQP